MKYKQQIITVFLSVVITLAIVFSALWGIDFLKSGSHSSSTVDVSMIQLIANPEQYDGKTVRVIGVGNLEFEGNCLSLSKENLAYGVGNSVWIELGNIGISYEEAKSYNGEYVIVEGVFDKDDCGHMDMFYGSIKNITRYERWEVIN